MVRFRNSSYYVERDGRVFSTKSNKYLKTDKHKGYLRVTLTIGSNRPKHYKVHRLVAECYIPNPNNLPDVNHKDGNKSNCNDWNLEWCTKSQNMKHAYKNGLITDVDKNLRLGSKIGAIATSNKFKAIRDNK